VLQMDQLDGSGPSVGYLPEGITGMTEHARAPILARAPIFYPQAEEKGERPWLRHPSQHQEDRLRR
jgi:hypothetical protein